MSAGGDTAAVAAYNRLVEADPTAAEQAAWLEAEFLRTGVTFGGQPMRSFLRPHFVLRQDWDVLRDTGRQLLELCERLARRVFEGDVGALCAFLGTPEAEARWVALDPGGPDVVLSRLDAFLTPAGPRYIELNSDAPAGFGYGDRMARAFAKLPLFQAFSKVQPVSYVPSGARLVESVLGVWGRGRPLPVVAIVDFGEVKTRPDQDLLKDAFAERGVTCLLADPRQMELRSGRLRLGERAVDLVYRRGLLQELLEKDDEVRDFFEAYRTGAALFVNSFRCRLSEDKAFLALLTDEAFAHLLTEAERALVARVVPWTRKVEERRTRKDGREIDLVPWVLENRSALVLKPAHGYGGQSVFVGAATSAEDWQKAVAAGTGHAWVVQEAVPIPEETFPVLEGGRLAFEPLKVNANPFYARGTEVGAVTRASRSAVINVSAGGGSAPTFVVG